MWLSHLKSRLWRWWIWLKLFIVMFDDNLFNNNFFMDTFVVLTVVLTSLFPTFSFVTARADDTAKDATNDDDST